MTLFRFLWAIIEKFFVSVFAGFGSFVILILVAGTLGYVTTFHGGSYHDFDQFSQEAWRSLVDVTRQQTGDDSWPTAALGWVNVGIKGGYAIQLAIIAALWRFAFTFPISLGRMSLRKMGILKK